MEKKYWIGRKRAAMAMARRASSSEARLIHYDMAGRYSIKAADCVPFLLAPGAAAGEAQALHALPLPSPSPRPGDRRDPT